MNFLKQYNGNPDWNVGGLFTHDDFWLPFLFQLREKDIEIPFQYIYGTPKDLFAGGGRRVAPFNFNVLKLPPRKIMQLYSDVGVNSRLALSNHLMTEEFFATDQTLNEYLEMLNYEIENSGVIIAEDSFNEYIKENYPNIQRICSVIRPAIEVGWGNDTVEYYNNLCENYDIVVVNCGFAKNINNIKKLKHKEKIEVLVNTRCTLNCKLAKQHYDIVAQGYMSNKIPMTDDQKEQLQKKEQELWAKCADVKSEHVCSGANFTIEEIQVLLDNGITHFKLEGRNWPVGIMVRDVGYYIFDEVMLMRLCKNIMGKEL